MGDIDENVLEPMVDRFVHGLFYPAILGANLILWIQRAGEGYDVARLLFWDQLSLQVAWMLTLLIFIMDYVGTATKGLAGAPPKTSTLGIIDLAGAGVFFYAQTKIVSAPGAQQVDWRELWFCLLFLHALYFAWYILRLLQASNAGATSAEFQKYLTYQLAVIGAQFIAICGISWIFWPIGVWHYSGLVLVAIAGWVVRQCVELYHV